MDGEYDVWFPELKPWRKVKYYKSGEKVGKSFAVLEVPAPAGKWDDVKEVKVRKEWQCSFCDGVIHKGNKAIVIHVTRGQPGATFFEKHYVHPGCVELRYR